MKTLFTLLALSFTPAFADEIYRIEVGQEDSSSDRELRRRVRQLERAVRQLQQRVFDLETTPQANLKPEKKEKTWICTVTAMGNTYTGTGSTKAIAMEKSIKDCRQGQSGDTFFCKSPSCQQ